MSISDPRGTDFDLWLRQEFARAGDFTALVVLVSIGETKVRPLCSTHLNVMGDEVEWAEIVALLAASGQEWDGVCFFPETARDGGALDNATARWRLRALEQQLDDDRLVLNEGHFFDKWGRRLKIEETPTQ
ncbi:hypothetical protein [Terrarubrum flagellatum]|uniref:hypothetical protein n=1 Tax=Terrirubrum flagellatum TaxID=2895980 RepID=UPI003145376C